MELHQLEYVLAVAKYTSFTRAAEEISTSQSSLSQQIGKLETELGVSLFDRTTRSVDLTPVGTEFIKHAQNVVTLVEEARQNFLDYVSLKKGSLSLGTIPIFGHYNLPNLITSFQKNFPGITLNIEEEMDEELLGMLQASQIDAAFVQRSTPNPDFRYYPLVVDRMVAVTSPRHPLAKRKSIHLTELQHENFIVPRTTSGHYHDLYNACISLGFTPKVILNCGVVKTMLGFVREDLGITVLSSHVAGSEQDEEIRIIPLTPTIDRKVVLAVKNSADLSPALKGFIKLTKQWVNSQVARENAKVTPIRATIETIMRLA